MLGLLMHSLPHSQTASIKFQPKQGVDVQARGIACKLATGYVHKLLGSAWMPHLHAEACYNLDGDIVPYGGNLLEDDDCIIALGSCISSCHT